MIDRILVCVAFLYGCLANLLGLLPEDQPDLTELTKAEF